jgi:predicted HTH transcriptional regulator
MRQMQRIIAQLKDDNRIKRVGPDKGGHWEIIE